MRRTGEATQKEGKAAVAVKRALRVEAGKIPKSNGHLNGELQELLVALRAMKAGDFSVRMTSTYSGEIGQIAGVFNDIIAANQRLEQQLATVGEAVGREGKTRHRVKLGVAAGAWGEME